MSAWREEERTETKREYVQFALSCLLSTMTGPTRRVLGGKIDEQRERERGEGEKERGREKEKLDSPRPINYQLLTIRRERFVFQLRKSNLPPSAANGIGDR